MYWWLIPLVATALTGVFAFSFWNGIRDRVKSWLGNLGLSKSLLSSALFQLDRFASALRGRILVKAKTSQMVYENTQYVRLEEIDDPEVQAAVNQTGFYQRDIMSLID